VFYNYHHKAVFQIDVAVPGDSKLIAKVNEKPEKYTDLKIELQRMWNFHVILCALVIGFLGSVSTCLFKHLKNLNIFYGTLVPKSVLLNSCHILGCACCQIIIVLHAYTEYSVLTPPSLKRSAVQKKLLNYKHEPKYENQNFYKKQL